MPPLFDNFGFLVYINEDCPKLAHSVADVLVLVICKQKNTRGEPHEVLLELGVQHDDIA